MNRAAATAAGYLAAKSQAVRRSRLLHAPSGEALETLRRAALSTAPPASFRQTLTAGESLSVVAEFKRRSPSGGPLSVEPPTEVADAYIACGAAAISVLTDSADFAGSLDDLAAVATVVRAPVLRKDFLVDAAGIFEARVSGAAAVLLIVGMLDMNELRSLLAAAQQVAIDCLVEVHDQGELDRAVDAGADIIGINNRDLHRLTTDLAVTERLAPRLPSGLTLVSESGLRTAADVVRVRDAGADAVLVGEALLRLSRRERCATVRSLAAVPRVSMRGQS